MNTLNAMHRNPH